MVETFYLTLSPFSFLLSITSFSCRPINKGRRTGLRLSTLVSASLIQFSSPLPPPPPPPTPPLSWSLVADQTMAVQSVGMIFTEELATFHSFYELFLEGIVSWGYNRQTCSGLCRDCEPVDIYVKRNFYRLRRAYRLPVFVSKHA